MDRLLLISMRNNSGNFAQTRGEVFRSDKIRQIHRDGTGTRVYGMERGKKSEKFFLLQGLGEINIGGRAMFNYGGYPLDMIIVPVRNYYPLDRIIRIYV